jgi:hypothetical protein
MLIFVTEKVNEDLMVALAASKNHLSLVILFNLALNQLFKQLILNNCD